MSEGQHSPRPSPASNQPWRQLGRAAKDAAGEHDVRRALERILARALRATHAERAFVVTSRVRGSAETRPRVVAISCQRSDGRDRPSRTVLMLALAGRRSFSCADVLRDPRLSVGASVKSLEIRSVLSAPVPTCASIRAAMVLDSRTGPRPDPSRLELVEGFAGLAGIVLRGAEDASVASAGRRTQPESVTPTLVGQSARFLETVDLARRVAPWRLPVLITGETGSGKEEISRLLHESSPRSSGPFVAVNCAAFPDTLLESELFGAVRGAYTGIDRDRRGLLRLAHGGTLLLDEVGDMSPPMQAKLLRVLQEGRVRPVGGDTEDAVDVRVVAATHRDLRGGIAAGRFREDLFYRLALIELHVPPLRERPEDVPLLARHLLAKLGTATGTEPPGLSAAAVGRLLEHDWPGNVRELEAVLARAILRAGSREIEPRHLELPPSGPALASGQGEPLEIRMVRDALRDCGGHLTRAAKKIGWSRQKLARKMLLYGIPRPTPRWSKRAARRVRPPEGK